MTSFSIAGLRFVWSRATFPVLVGSMLVPVLGGAQATPSGTIRSPFRITVSTGGIAPRSALIVDRLGGGDTRVAAAPAVGLDLQYEVARRASLYMGGTVAFSTLFHGTNLGVAARGESSDAMLVAATAGLLLEGPSGWSGGAMRPTLRLGGGLKAYEFSTPGSSISVTPAGDFGVGFRTGTPVFELSAEVRYLPGTFDQSKLPTRGIMARKQQQNDLLFGIGVTFRP